MASPRLRREEPWRSNALKAPPRRSTGALLAGCAPARPLIRLYHRAPCSCQPRTVAGAVLCVRGSGSTNDDRLHRVARLYTNGRSPLSWSTGCRLS